MPDLLDCVHLVVNVHSDIAICRCLWQITWAADGKSEEEQEDLYILAGIDMANHSTDAARRNATVNLRPADGPGAGTFVLTAGEALLADLLSSCCPFSGKAHPSVYTQSDWSGPHT